MEDPAPDRRVEPDRPTGTAHARRGARLLLDRGADLLAARRVPRRLPVTTSASIGFDDPEVTAAALLGAGQARYRMDDEAGAVATWEEILELPETPSTYHAWRDVAAARVRDGDLQGAIAAYREADRRAPAEDKAGDREPPRLAGEGDRQRPGLAALLRPRPRRVMPLATYAILGITVAVSLAAELSTEGGRSSTPLELDKPAVADGEIWRLWTVTLVHGGHRSTSPSTCTRCISAVRSSSRSTARSGCSLFYLVAALGGSIATFAFGDARLGVGASGAIFGLFGILFVASRLHMPLLDRRGRALLGQIGVLIVINLLFGFALPGVDNLAHIGGLVAGVLLGVAFPPGTVATLRSMWQPGADRPARDAVHRLAGRDPPVPDRASSSG